MNEAPKTFGPYEVRATLGRGGMGQVYLAEDPRLRRKVAIKVLPGTHALDPERKARFLTEARAASALNHPNIVTIFDVGNDGQTDYLVMEYVQGSTLRELMKRRIGPREAAEIAAQIASGLTAAHAKGIVHRDIKPENVVIAADGTAKILDYGVAKLLDEPTPDGTTSEHVTTPGAIVGTLAYMSPEQVQGQEIDHRSDIFSLGVVLCEMLSGRNPFEAPTLSGTMQRIVTAPPPPETISPTVPRRAREIVTRALALRPSDRYQSARDLELDLRAAIGSSPSEDVETGHPTRTARPLAAAMLLAFLGGAVLALIADRLLLQKDQEAAAPHFSFAPLTSDPGYEGEPTFSADGQTIAYVSDRTGNFEIFLKQISGGPEINLTNDPADDVQPAFSPDGKQIAFVSTRSSETSLLYRNPTIEAMGGDIWVMSALGGSPKRIVQNGNFPAWSPDGGSIVFVRGAWSAQKIYRVAASGGTPQVVPMTLAAQPLFITTPQFSRDGKWISFSSHQPNNICVMPAGGGAASVIAEGRQASWQPDSKSIIYSDLAPGRNSTLSLIPIDGAGKPSGPSIPLTSGRGADRTPVVSPDGRTVVFASQSISFNVERIPFDGDAGKAVGPPETITRGGDFSPFFSVAPDGSAVVFQSQRGLRLTLWRQEIVSGVLTQLTGDDKAAYSMPEWSPDGRHIAFLRTEPGKPGATWVMDSDGANPHLVIPGSGFVSWLPDNRALAFWDSEHRDVRLLDLATKEVRVLANEGTVRTLQKFSADGKWMLYQAIGETGLTEVRVVAVGNTKSRVLVRSPHENGHPFFSPDLRWIYFQPDHKNIYRIPGPAQNFRNAPPQQVTFFPESNLYLEQPQLSADGNYLYYSRRSAASDLWVAKRSN